ncbi:ataxin-7-like protein 2b isoform X1 [Electrophorus electricus]|uniref:SCA7 domain-containing protein n=2 Tax=Electrophorus electricus TaxID=8005 RepID=A0A4W4FVQ3_ELEEL|nr:ataxin-7-like protein 2b isoform X1 [Electrophorus electricus]
MAALDRRISILDEFVGQSWNSWIDKADVSTPEGSSGEECSKNVKKRMETMTLRKEDMCIYGHCPAHDEFYLVVCSHCGQVVKPQAFEKHCEHRHGPISKLYGPHASLSLPQSHWLHIGRPPAQHGGLREAHDGKQQAAGPLRVPQFQSPIHKAPKAQKDRTSVLQLDQYPHGNPPSPPCLSMPTPRDPPWHRGPASPRMPPPAEKALQKGTHMPRALHGPRTYSRTYKKVPKKECDLDKHCGVLDPERKKLCTRLLTCNIHSIHQRRQVEGRSKSFDQLVLELKMSAKARERAPLARDAPTEGSPCPQAPTAEPGPQACRRHTASYVSLRSRTPSESGVEVNEWDPCSEGVEGVSTLRPPTHSASSEESDGENYEESKDLPTSTCHPKPLGLCTFGARVLGCNMWAFDRRLFHLRSALSAMVEQHLSAHLWKKIPQVSELRSHHTSSAYTSALQSAYISHDAMYSPPSRVPTPSASSLRTSTSSVPKRPPGDISTSGQSEARASSLTHPSKTLTKAHITSATSQPHNSVGRPSKQALQARLRQLQESPTPRKRRKSPPEEEDSLTQNRNISIPCHRDRQPSSARLSLSPSYGPINGVLLPGSKPRPRLHVSETGGLISGRTSPLSPPESSSHDGCGASGLHRRALGHEQKGPVKKRQTSSASSLEVLSRQPKPNSLSSTHTPSSLFAWRRDSKAGPVSLSMEKKLEAQKPKLHH